MITAIFIPADPADPLRLKEIDEHDLGTYRRLVGGDLEMFNFDRPSASMYARQDGKRLRLPINPRATALVSIHPSSYRGWHVISGPAFIVGPDDDDGDDTSAPPDLIDLLLHTARYRLQVKTRGERKWSDTQLVYTDWRQAYRDGIQLADRSSPAEEVRVVPVLDDELRETWYQLGLNDPWIRRASDPPFTKDSFTGCYSIEELAERISETSWPTGAAFYYRDMCVIQRLQDDEEWLTIRRGIAIESMPMALTLSIEDGTFASLVRRLLAASKEQCERREY